MAVETRVKYPPRLIRAYLGFSGALLDPFSPATALDRAKGAIVLYWWRWLCRVLGFSRPVYALSEELRADERRRKATKRAA